MEDLPDTPMEDVTLVISAKKGKKKKVKSGDNLNALANVDLLSSEMVHSDAVISPKQGKLKEKKNKRKRGKNSDAITNVDLIHKPIDGTGFDTDSRLEQRDVQVEDCDNIRNTSFGNSSLSNGNNISSRDSSSMVDTKITLGLNVNQVPEASVNPVSMVVEHNDQVCANNGSKKLSSDAPLAKKKIKKKGKKGRENLNIASSNDVQFNGLNAPSVNNHYVENESIQLATTSTGLVVTEVMLHGAELGLPVESLKGMHQSTCGSSVEIRCVEGRPVSADLKSTQEADTNSFSKVAESDSQACTGTNSISQGLSVGAIRTKRNKKKGRANVDLLSSEMVHSDAVISPKQGKLKEKKNKRKRGKNSDAITNVDLIRQPNDGTGLDTDSRLEQHDVQVEDCDNIRNISFGNSSLSNGNNISSRDSSSMVDTKITLEVNVNQFPEASVMNPVSMVVEHNDQVCANNGSKKLSSDAPLAKKKIKRKGKKGRENLNIASSNDVQFNGLNAPSVNNHYVENESIQLATTSTGLVVTEVMLHGAELGLPVESLKGMHQSTCGSSVEIRCVEGRPVSADLKSTQEADTNSFSKVVESDSQTCTGTNSISQGLGVGAIRTKRKKKEGRAKNQISPTSNDELHDNLKSLSLVSENPIYNDSIQHPVIDSCLVTCSEEVQHHAKLGQRDDNDKENLDKHTKVNAETTPKADADPIHKVAENDDLACSVYVSEKMVAIPLQTEKTKRKKKKKNLNKLVRSVIMPNTSVMGDSGLMQHRAEEGTPQGIHLNECATKDKNCSGEASSGIIDIKVDETSVPQGKTVGNMQGGKKRKRKIRGKNLNLVPKEDVISTNGLSEEQHVKRAPLNADQNAGLGRILTGCACKKLLVLDLNGLLADVVGDKTVTIQADGRVAGKKVFKRPFCEDFLQFCFENFTVGVWSSRRKENVDKVLQILMRGSDRSKLAFVWNQSHCTRTGFQTVENLEKPLFLKELSKLWKWENENRNFGWKVGDYDKSNTLLLDDSPYKALQNPPYTAIFPAPYQYQDQNDNALGLGGDLRVYLEGLALAEDVQKYVKQNPFGQRSITNSNPSWAFYVKVIRSTSRKQRSKPNRSTSRKQRSKRNQNKSNPSLKNRVVPASKSVPV